VFWKQINGKLTGWPDDALTLAMIGTAGLLVIGAVALPAHWKAGVLAWVLFP
jgi:hypothetical protein